jgi:hypothetical protein
MTRAIALDSLLPALFARATFHVGQFLAGDYVAKSAPPWRTGIGSGVVLGLTDRAAKGAAPQPRRFAGGRVTMNRSHPRPRSSAHERRRVPRFGKYLAAERFAHGKGSDWR